MNSRLVSLRIGVLALLLALPGFGASNRTRTTGTDPDAFVCGTSQERNLSALVKGQYFESRSRKNRIMLADGPVAAAADVGDVSIIEDDGSIISEVNLFDLAGKSIRFEAASSGTYRVTATSTAYEAAGGPPILLDDDDSRLISLGFTFVFYGTSYTSVHLNSDGILTFVTPDTATTPRDLQRFVSGPPRIGPFFADLDPRGGTVSTRQDPDGRLFSWDRVPEFEKANSNSFSVKLFTNGSLEFSYGSRVDGKVAVVGISPGSNQGGISAVNYSNDLPTSNLPGSIVEVFSEESEISETALAKRFFQNHPDDFDHLIVFLGFGFSLGEGFAYELNVRNEIRGIGLRLFDNSSFYGSTGRLRSFLMMGDLSRYPQDPNQQFLGTNSTMGVLGQESGHRWLAFTSFLDGGIVSRAILGRDNSHWSFFFDSDASVMEGNDIDDLGDGRFRTIGATSTYSRLDQYAIGLVSRQEVPNMFLVQNPTGTLRRPESNPQIGVSFGGTRKNLTIDDIVAANGPRIPSVLQSPKVFRQAFIILTRKGQQPTANQVAQVQRVRDAWARFFNEQTGRRGWVVTNLQNSPGTTATPIYFPYFRGDSRRYTGIAVANWGSTPADVLFQAYDNSGNPISSPSTIINPRMITIPAGEQIAMLGEQIHGLSMDTPRDGWIEGRSTSSQVTGFFLDGDVDLTLLDGAVAGNTTSTELYFTRAQLGSSGFAGVSYRNLIDVINPNSSPAALQLQLLDEFGAVKGTASRTLPPRGRVAQDLSALFPGISQPLTTGYLKLTSDLGVIGYQSLDSGSSIFALPAQRASLASKLYSAQFASGSAGVIFFTDINLINTSSQARSVQIVLVDNNGMPVGGIKNPVTLNLAANQQIRARGESVFGLPDPAVASTLTEGSMVFTVNGPGIIGDVTFGDPVQERFIASLPLDWTPVSNFIFSQVAEGSVGGGKRYFTGIAMYNPNDNDVSVTIDVFSETGVKTGSATFVLPRGARRSRTLPQLVPAVTNQIRGYIRITTSGGPVVSFELFGGADLEFLAAVPPQPITP